MTPEQIDNPIAKVESKEALILADLAAIFQDLGATMHTCSHLIELLKEDSKDQILIESLWTSALIRYARCFTASKRFGLSESIFDGLQGDPVGAHRLYINLRNKHIAHSVNPFEQMEVGVILSPVKSAEKEVLGVATLSMRLISHDVEGIRQLGTLAKVVMEKVSKLAKDYEQKVIEEARKIPIDDLYKRPRLRLVAAGPESAGKPRP
ncbi:MAG: hypothetical protein AABY54_02750 [Deltaproteobacteria bacterium]